MGQMNKYLDDQKINWQYVADRRMELLRKADARMNDLEATIRDQESKNHDLIETFADAMRGAQDRVKDLHRSNGDLRDTLKRLYATIDRLNQDLTIWEDRK